MRRINARQDDPPTIATIQERNLSVIVGLNRDYFRNLQLLDIKVKIQEEIGHKDRNKLHDTYMTTNFSNIFLLKTWLTIQSHKQSEADHWSQLR